MLTVLSALFIMVIAGIGLFFALQNKEKKSKKNGISGGCASCSTCTCSIPETDNNISCQEK